MGAENLAPTGDTDKSKQKRLERNLYQWHFAQHKSDIEWPDSENE
jgi:hypothetical protein